MYFFFIKLEVEQIVYSDMSTNICYDMMYDQRQFGVTSSLEYLLALARFAQLRFQLPHTVLCSSWAMLQSQCYLIYILPSLTYITLVFFIKYLISSMSKHTQCWMYLNKKVNKYLECIFLVSIMDFFMCG